jgi:aspartate aminotransferase
MRNEFARRRELTCKLLQAMPDIKLTPPEGAFYAFFDASPYYGKTFGAKVVKDSLSFCDAMLEQAHVNMVAGAAFGAPRFVRMSFATNAETIQTGLGRMAEWLATGKQ